MRDMVVGSSFGNPCSHDLPRPLRSAARPWGVHGLIGPEVKQLSVGARLLLTSFETTATVVLRGGASVAEHPATPDDESYPSIWRTAYFVNYLSHLPFARLHRFRQFQYGAEVVKPTNLGIGGLPSFSRRFAELADRNAPYPTSHLGRYDWLERRFKTAVAKEYPEGLSKVLVISTLMSLKDRIDREGFTDIKMDAISMDAQAWMGVMEAESSVIFAQSFLPDYQA